MDTLSPKARHVLFAMLALCTASFLLSSTMVLYAFTTQREARMQNRGILFELLKRERRRDGVFDETLPPPR